MRKTLAKLPSPAMAVAFLALLAALTGTAVALPGSNTVTTGDIKGGAVRSSDIKNNNVRGRDVRTSTLRGSDVGANTLTGSDINEGSLGPVQVANTANAASFASVAGLAGRTNGVQFARSVGASEDSRVLLVAAGGFQVILNCDNDGSDDGTQTLLRNVSAGNNSHMDDNVQGDEEDDFDQGDEATLADSSDTDSIENGAFTAIGSGGSAIHGQSASVNSPDYTGAPDCVGSASVLGS